MHPKNFLPVIAGAIAGAVVALAVSGGGDNSTRTITQVVSSTNPVARSVPTSLSKRSGLSVNQIYRQDSPGVVDITVTSESQANQGLGLFGGGGGGTQETEGEGAGVVYNTRGDILTDEHVVANATSVEVHFQDGVNAKANVLGTDSSTDVAVIHVDVPSSELHPIRFADSNDAQVGDAVVAIGSPFSLPETTTAGIVSAVGRSIMAPNNYTITGAIQTDAAINPGNSGGPLLDANGDVLGLNDQIQTSSGDSAGVGFATPGNADVLVADKIVAGKTVTHAYVGVCLESDTSGGAQISASPDQQCPTPVVGGSPAAKAGLRAGDVILAIDGQTLNSTNAFIASISSDRPGQIVTFTIKRDGSVHTVKLTLANRPRTAPTG